MGRSSSTKRTALLIRHGMALPVQMDRGHRRFDRHWYGIHLTDDCAHPCAARASPNGRYRGYFRTIRKEAAVPPLAVLRAGRRRGRGGARARGDPDLPPRGRAHAALDEHAAGGVRRAPGPDAEPGLHGAAPGAVSTAALEDPAEALPDGAVALTFDDGYRSVYTEAFPRLRARGWPFTVFVSPEAIDAGSGPACTWDELPGDGRRRARPSAATACATTTCSGGGPGRTTRPGGPRVTRGTDRGAGAHRRRDRQRRRTLLAYPYGEWSPELAALVADGGMDRLRPAVRAAAGPASDCGVLPRFPAAGSTPIRGPWRPSCARCRCPCGRWSRRIRGWPWRPGTPAARRPDLRLVLDPARRPLGRG